MNYRTDLILGKAFCIFIFFHFPDYEPPYEPGLHFHFWWRDKENTEYNTNSMPPAPSVTFLFQE